MCLYWTLLLGLIVNGDVTHHGGIGASQNKTFLPRAKEMSNWTVRGLSLIIMIRFPVCKGPISESSNTLSACNMSVSVSPTWVRAVRGLHQVSPLVNAGHCFVAQTSATLLHLPVACPALQQPRSWGTVEDARRPVPVGLGQELNTGTRLRLLQRVELLVQAMLLLFTATWGEDWRKRLRTVVAWVVVNPLNENGK